RPILGMPLELFLEERRRRGFRDARLSRHLVVPDRFLVQATSVRVPVVLGQGRDDFGTGFSSFGTSLPAGTRGGMRHTTLHLDGLPERLVNGPLLGAVGAGLFGLPCLALVSLSACPHDQ